MELLRELLQIQSVSGDESRINEFLKSYIGLRKFDWKVLPEVFCGEQFQDCVLLKFGAPRTAVFAHLDTIGFMSRYENQLITIGGPELLDDTKIVGNDALGPISCNVQIVEDFLFHDFPRAVLPGTCFSFAQEIKIDGEFIQAAYLDNRLGIYNALKLCEEIEDGWIVFSTYEENGGGSVPFLLDFIQKTSPIRQALISDITWITEGVNHHNGVAISIRDKFIPRRVFVDKIISLAQQSGIPYQIEVEGVGGSDGKEIQFSPYPIDWCFIGAAEDNVHTPYEKVSLMDLDSMLRMYKYLMVHL
ncbi:aminopeptidase [Rhodonellum sp.]|uniref:aminopeptidase n=1 Tax=Rhodonellum sp. TaxID=2231180 RepID=UPI00271CB5EE|nr:aminopeptidase [Rhodonellum sp.]MDO9552050.1 aminopeptidase [Rhodonellum sp.]